MANNMKLVINDNHTPTVTERKVNTNKNDQFNKLHDELSESYDNYSRQQENLISCVRNIRSRLKYNSNYKESFEKANAENYQDQFTRVLEISGNNWYDDSVYGDSENFESDASTDNDTPNDSESTDKQNFRDKVKKKFSSYWGKADTLCRKMMGDKHPAFSRDLHRLERLTYQAIFKPLKFYKKYSAEFLENEWAKFGETYSLKIDFTEELEKTIRREREDISIDDLSDSDSDNNGDSDNSGAVIKTSPKQDPGFARLPFAFIVNDNTENLRPVNSLVDLSHINKFISNKRSAIKKDFEKIPAATKIVAKTVEQELPKLRVKKMFLRHIRYELYELNVLIKLTQAKAKAKYLERAMLEAQKNYQKLCQEIEVDASQYPPYALDMAKNEYDRLLLEYHHFRPDNVEKFLPSFSLHPRTIELMQSFDDYRKSFTDYREIINKSNSKKLYPISKLVKGNRFARPKRVFVNLRTENDIATNPIAINTFYTILLLFTKEPGYFSDYVPKSQFLYFPRHYKLTDMVRPGRRPLVSKFFRNPSLYYLNNRHNFEKPLVLIFTDKNTADDFVYHSMSRRLPDLLRCDPRRAKHEYEVIKSIIIDEVGLGNFVDSCYTRWNPTIESVADILIFPNVLKNKPLTPFFFPIEDKGKEYYFINNDIPKIKNELEAAIEEVGRLKTRVRVQEEFQDMMVDEDLLMELELKYIENPIIVDTVDLWRKLKRLKSSLFGYDYFS